MLALVAKVWLGEHADNNFGSKHVVQNYFIHTIQALLPKQCFHL